MSFGGSLSPPSPASSSPGLCSRPCHHPAPSGSSPSLADHFSLIILHLRALCRSCPPNHRPRLIVPTFHSSFLSCKAMPSLSSSLSSSLAPVPVGPVSLLYSLLSLLSLLFCSNDSSADRILDNRPHSHHHCILNSNPVCLHRAWPALARSSVSGHAQAPHQWWCWWNTWVTPLLGRASMCGDDGLDRVRVPACHSQ